MRSLALVEVGPGQALATLSRQHDRRVATQLITTSLHPGQDSGADIDYLLAAAGQLWTRNVDIDWRALHGGAQRRRVPLPTYPFRASATGSIRCRRATRWHPHSSEPSQRCLLRLRSPRLPFRPPTRPS